MRLHGGLHPSFDVILPLFALRRVFSSKVAFEGRKNRFAGQRGQRRGKGLLPPPLSGLRLGMGLVDAGRHPAMGQLVRDPGQWPVENLSKSLAELLLGARATGAGQLPQAGPQSVEGSLFEQERALVFDPGKGDAQGFARGFRLLARVGGGRVLAKSLAGLVQGTARARGVVRPAQGRAAVHERLVDITWVLAIDEKLGLLAHPAHQGWFVGMARRSSGSTRGITMSV